MIAHLTGTVLSHDTSSVIIDVGGIGYKVFVTDGAVARASEGDKLSLFTHLAVRENALDLYGFLERDEIRFFELLLTVSGIGPKSALSILNIAPVATLRQAIAANDSTYLTKVSGIGNKSAQKIVLELQDKVGKETEDATGVRVQDLDTLEALKALGYSAHEVRSVLRTMRDDTQSTNERIKEALKLLAKQ